MHEAILQLIAEYGGAVSDAFDALVHRFGTTEVLRAVRRDAASRSGTLGQGDEYAFHGIGCRVTQRGVTVDFDFGPNGTVGGFDAWRLWAFAAELPAMRSCFSAQSAVEAALQGLREAGLIELPGASPSRHLYYLTSAGEAAIAACERCRMVVRQRLLAYISSPFTEGDAVALSEVIASLADAPWSCGAPQFVDETDHETCTSEGDEPIRTLGAVLFVHAPGARGITPVTEPTRFLAALAKLSKARGVELEVELDETYVGSVTGGEMDRLLREGLLASWEVTGP
jgi:hypothetical protein